MNKLNPFDVFKVLTPKDRFRRSMIFSRNEECTAVVIRYECHDEIRSVEVRTCDDWERHFDETYGDEREWLIEANMSPSQFPDLLLRSLIEMYRRMTTDRVVKDDRLEKIRAILEE